jgi:hypothetical protein
LALLLTFCLYRSIFRAAAAAATLQPFRLNETFIFQFISRT